MVLFYSITRFDGEKIVLMNEKNLGKFTVVQDDWSDEKSIVNRKAL